MSITIDANMRIFAERMNITSSRMKNDYGQSTVDEIIQAEAKSGNTSAVDYAMDYYHSPEKLVEIFKLTDTENKYSILMGMSSIDRVQIMPMLDQEDLVMGLYFFTQEKLLQMLMEVDIEELVNVAKEAFSLEKLVLMFTEEDLSKFMANKDLNRFDVMEQLKSMPPEVIQKFVEGVTGMPSSPESFNQIITNLNSLSDDKFSKFMAMIDPDVQRQLTFQLTQQNPEYLQLFENITYVRMLSTLMKPEMVKPMIMLEKETLVDMMLELTPELMSIVGAQVNAEDLAKFLQDGRMELLQKALVR